VHPGSRAEMDDSTGRLSRDAENTLRDELRDAVGDRADRIPRDRLANAAEERPSALLGVLRTNRLLIGITFATALVVGVVLSLALESWWLLVAALVVHFLTTAVVVGMTLAATAQVEKPDPTAVSALESEGVSDPERTINELSREVAGPPGDQTRGAGP
jgi:Flp pilus assembly protein TadB